ncbi:MAG: hypothetical protein RMJ56_10380 [Gemmataceae bacterium]|nr:hypothetical protein [Gemmata sp.]MDW8197997.1 hypothetical protein [Gemmataceae bacterium]
MGFGTMALGGQGASAQQFAQHLRLQRMAAAYYDVVGEVLGRLMMERAQHFAQPFRLRAASDAAEGCDEQGRSNTGEEAHWLLQQLFRVLGDEPGRNPSITTIIVTTLQQLFRVLGDEQGCANTGEESASGSEVLRVPGIEDDRGKASGPRPLLHRRSADGTKN